MERALADESVTKFAGRYRLAVYIIPRMYKMSIMQIHQVTQIFCRTDVVVVGHNPENADYDNPRGAIFGFCGYVIAEAPDGSRWEFDRTMTGHFEAEVLARLETFVAYMQWQVKNGRKLDATHWTPARPCYGSEAYASGGWSHEDAMLERMADRDGEGCEPFFGQRS